MMPAPKMENPKKPKEEPQAEKRQQQQQNEPPPFNPEVGNAVLNLLGKPKNLKEVRAKHLWDNRYRVNVWCNIQNTNNPLYDHVKITDSFFVVASPEGGIISSSPPIAKKYGPNNPAASDGPQKPTIADILKP